MAPRCILLYRVERRLDRPGNDVASAAANHPGSILMVVISRLFYEFSASAKVVCNSSSVCTMFLVS